MSKSKILIVMLVLALLASNAWLAYRLVDSGISLTYMRASQETDAELLSQALSILQVVARPGYKRNDVIAAARVPKNTTEPFEKEGFVWVGQLGLKFDSQGQFIKAVAGPSATEK